MNRYRSDQWSNRKTVRNLQYLDAIQKRKSNMPQPFVDPMGVPIGGNSQPQNTAINPVPQNTAINPVLQMLWPVFAQSIHDILTSDPVRVSKRMSDGTMCPAHTAQQVVDTAWEIANRAIQYMGFEFVFPMGIKVITLRELHEAERDAADAVIVAPADDAADSV